MLEVLYIYTFMIIYVAILQGRDRDESGCGNILLFYTSKVWITNITNWPLAEVSKAGAKSAIEDHHGS